MKIKKPKHSLYFLLGILAIAAVLRFNHINQPFVDIISWRQTSNAMMAENFYRKNWNILYPEVNWHGPGPSYNGREFQTVTYIAARLYTLLGQHDWVGRLVAILFGLWGIFALYQLVRRVWDEERAIASAAVMALLPGSIFIDHSFMPDPAMVALVTTAFWLLVAYLQTNRWHYLILASVISAWGFLTKLPGLIIGLPMIYAMMTILRQRKKLHWKQLILLSVVAALMLIPVIAYYLWARHLAVSYPPYHFAGGGNWVWDNGLRNWLSEKYFLSKLIHNFSVWMWTAPIFVLVVFGLIFPPPKNEPVQATTSDELQANSSAKAPWVFHWWLLAFIVYYMIGAEELVNNPWNFHILNPAAAALAGHAIITTASRWLSIAGATFFWVVIVAFLVMIGGFGQDGLQWAYKPYAENNYKLGLALRQITQPNDLVVTLENPIGEPVAIYYSQRRGWVFPPADTDYWGQLPQDDQEAIRMFERLRIQGADWFGVVEQRKNDFWKDHPVLVKHITRTCEFKTKTSAWFICRILTPEEVAKLSN